LFCNFTERNATAEAIRPTTVQQEELTSSSSETVPTSAIRDLLLPTTTTNDGNKAVSACLLCEYLF